MLEPCTDQALGGGDRNPGPRDCTLDPEAYLRDVFRVLPHWPHQRFLELAPRYWPLTRARFDRVELDRELGALNVPEQPLPTILSNIDRGLPLTAAQ